MTANEFKENTLASLTKIGMLPLLFLIAACGRPAYIIQKTAGETDTPNPSTTPSPTPTASPSPSVSPDPKTYLLSLNKDGYGSINGHVVGNTSNTINCGTQCAKVFPENAQMTLTASPATGQVFSSWSGACSGTNTTCTVTMSEARTVTANFTAASYPLNLARTGNGSISGYVLGATSNTIQCGTLCSKDFLSGLVVHLTANPAAGQVFSNWSGACTGTNTTCNVTISATRNVTANFASATTHPLTLSKTGNGSINGYVIGNTSNTINCGTQCEKNFPENVQVTLTATPASGQVFSSWSGGTCSGTNPTCNVTMSGPNTVTANFTAAATSYTLTLAKTGTGQGSINGYAVGDNANTINCGTQCSKNFSSGTQVHLEAIPADGQTFLGWSGDCSGANAICTVTVNSPRSATAEFAAAPISSANLSFTPNQGEFIIDDTYSGSSRTRVFQITNNTQAAASINSILLSPSGTPFSVSSNTCDNASILPQGSCSLTVAFSPAYDPLNEFKDWEATLRVGYQLGQENRVRSWSLQATSLNSANPGNFSIPNLPTIARTICTPIRVQFVAWNTSAPVARQNPMTVNATLFDVASASLYVDPLCLTQTTSVTLPAGVDPGLIYAMGSRLDSGSIRIDNGATSTSSFIQFGFASQPEISVSPENTHDTTTSLSFGTVPVGGSTSRELKIRNSVEGPIVFGSATVSGAGYSIDANSCRNSMTAGNECTVLLTFSPHAGQSTDSGSISVSYQIGDDSYSLVKTLSGQIEITSFSTTLPLDSSGWQYDSSRIQVDASGAHLVNSDQLDNDNSNQGFAGGSFQNTKFDYSLNALKIDSGRQGMFTSRVFGAPGSYNWTSLSWAPLAPYSKSLPDNGEADGTLNMSELGNIALFHFDDPDAVTNSSGTAGTVTVGNVTATRGKIGLAGQFRPRSNSTGYSKVKLSLSSMSSEHFSIALWVKMPEVISGARTLFSHFKSTESFRIYHYPSGLRIRIEGVTADPEISIDNNEWNHLTLTWSKSGGATTLYRNGVLVFSGTVASGKSLQTNGALVLGQDQDTLAGGFDDDQSLNGDLDEVALFNTTLSASDVQKIYRRGAQRLKFQVAGCETQDCGNAQFVGPNNSTSEYFGEMGQTTAAFSILNKPYFRYRAFLETDDSSSPLFSSVAVGPGHFDSSPAPLTMNTGIAYITLALFSEQVALGSQGTVTYQLSRDGIHWYWFDGQGWSNALTASNSSSAAEINSTIASFPATVGTGQLRIRAYLHSTNGVGTPQLQALTVSGYR